VNNAVGVVVGIAIVGVVAFVVWKRRVAVNEANEATRRLVQSGRDNLIRPEMFKVRGAS